jgi:hypothetical protein
MQQIEPLNPVETRKVSPMVLVIGGILAVTVLFLLLPSSRTTKIKKAKEKLSREFAGPQDLSYLYHGFFVTSKNRNTSIGPKSVAELSIFAPDPKSAFSSRYFEEVDGNNWNMYGIRTEHACLLAPDPASTGWSLYSKVWIALTLQSEIKQPVFNLGTLVAAGDAGTLKKLQSIWSKMPHHVQSKAEALLQNNRNIVKGMPGVHRFFRDSTGTNYKIDVNSGPYDFISTYNEANPNLRSD